MWVKAMAARREEEDRSYPEHPLFPLEEGGKPFDVSYINVSRKEGGAMVFVPQIFKAEELTSQEQILERYGGGFYELHARSQSPIHPGQAWRITKRRTFTLPGRPKPLDPGNATMQEEIAAGLRPSPHDAVPKPQGGAMGDSGVLVAILQMNAQAAERAQQSSMQFMTMFMQMMQSSKQESAQMMQTMMTAMTAMSSSQQQSMMQMLPLLVQSKGGGPEELDKYLGLFQKLGLKPSNGEAAKGEEQEMNVGQVLSDVATIVSHAPGAISALKEMAPPLPGAMPSSTLPVGEPLPGSAASVLAGKG
jgi:hypothetical protein